MGEPDEAEEPSTGTGRRSVLRGGAAAAAGLLPGLSACGSGSDSGSGHPKPKASAAPSRSATASHRPSPLPTRRADWGALAKSLDGRVVRPGGRGYDDARRVFNARFDSVRPAAVAYCTRPEDVAECLRFARSTGTPFTVRSGGHSYAGWSTGRGLVVDVSELSSISVSGGTATIGAGAKLMSVYDRLAARGVTVPAGSCPTVGISGLALGGGHGVVSRAYGLTCDSLSGAEVVLADGRIAQVSANRDKELFWALRGAGNGNFGVVTELRFTTHPAPDCVTFSLTWPWARAAETARAWQEWLTSAPDRLWTHLVLKAGTGGRPTVSVGGLHLGDEGDLYNHLDRLSDRAGAPTTSSVTTRTYLKAMYYMAGCSETAVCLRQTAAPYTGRSHFHPGPLSSDALATLTDRIGRLRGLPAGGEGSVQLSALGGAVNRVGAHETAFVHRNSFLLGQYLVSWPRDASKSAVNRSTSWLDATHSALRPYTRGEAYQNYTDPGLRDWRQAYYGDNLPRLEKAKATYDPDRLFRFPQAI
ncbi:FAD-binding oxidoreductase [Wenjunlia tyrosinilytica]|uniref:FAD-binding dehydrogenase n=1 Tax=Wenjunlia tyrosinilytica TaxID=1544741 RepID=A0A917ZPV0_9ACTN|nr:FAD-binding oxidoreductase [Wenjunlia tyrosinilytica]GGO87354.1 FAD-binding dehydrogenase [Wenjunlia tyrosinilytica]